MTSETSENALEPKQLSMSVPTSSVAGIPDARVPDGYVLRQYRPGDEDSWQGLLRAGGFSEDWSSRTVRDYMLDPVRRAGSWVAASGEDLVSATFATPDAQCAEIAFLDYVVTHPDHRSKGLSRAVCTGVMRFFLERGYRRIRLLTDDWRLPAISLYLSMGFEPEMTRADMPGRWREVREKLSEAT